MALVAAWLVWRTGGLEAAITLHVVNNIVGFLMMTLAFGGETKQTAEGGSAISLFASVLGQVLFAWWIDRDFKRVDGRRTRIDRVQKLVAVVPARPRGGGVTVMRRDRPYVEHVGGISERRGCGHGNPFEARCAHPGA